jgi:hypothetical protein
VKSACEGYQRREADTRPPLDDVVEVHEPAAEPLREQAVHLVGRPDAPQMGVELPFPCVWVSRWSRAAGLNALRDSLVVSVFTRDEALVDALICEPSIRNVYLGNQPSHWSRPGMPHDGYVAEFLMRTKGAISA